MENTRRKPVRLEDIAQRVGVSRSEVSRVLNGQLRAGRSIGRAKQERILEVARELNYQPNKAAQNLARGKTDTVGLIVQISADRELSPHYHEIVGALTHTLSEYQLHLLLVQWDGGSAESLTQVALTRSCDAILLTDIQVNDPRPKQLRELGQPCVIRGSSPYAGFHAVGMDNKAVGRLAIDHLARLGHRRILFHNIGKNLMAGIGRFQGFEEAVAEHGLQETVRYADHLWGEEGVYTLTREALAQPERPSAIFAADELAAVGALRAIAEKGLRVPEDISVLSCLNARFMRMVHPALSVINVRQHEVAIEAAHVIARLLQGEAGPPQQTFLLPSLDEGRTCGPAAA